VASQGMGVEDALGIRAFLALLVVFYLMIAKPA
jgi:uncharacterized membrane protein